MNSNYLDTQSKLITDSYFLVLLFMLCAAGMILISNIIFYCVYVFIYHLAGTSILDPVPKHIWLALGIFNFIIISFMSGAYWFRMILLSSGGAAVAEYCGGIEITAQDHDYYSKRFQDVVEEMAIACSVSVPRTYLLKYVDNINAFAAGYTQQDAAITVTRGAMEQLNRDELQAVIAHEFSHIVHNDMRLNMQLIAFQSSMNVFLDSTWIFDPTRYESFFDYLFIPLTPIIILMIPFGVIGAIFSSLLKLGLNRKREFLADASAIRYTRYALGLLGALKKIGSVPSDNAFDDSTLQFVSHMMFDDKAVLSGLVASHPPVMSRIQLIDPEFTPDKLLLLRDKYREHLPNGKQEDQQLGYCSDGENYIRKPDHLDASIGNETSSQYMSQLQKIHNTADPGDVINRIFWILFVVMMILSMSSIVKHIYYDLASISEPPPGILVQEDPEITLASDKPAFTANQFTITPIGSYNIRARVISVTHYNDDLATLSPLEFALGWGPLSDSAVIDKSRITLVDRHIGYYYLYSTKLGAEDFSKHLARAMIIVANTEVANVISNVRINNIIELSGYLVDIGRPSNEAVKSYLWDSGSPSRPYELILWVESAAISKF